MSHSPDRRKMRLKSLFKMLRMMCYLLWKSPLIKNGSIITVSSCCVSTFDEINDYPCVFHDIHLKTHKEHEVNTGFSKKQLMS